MLHRRSFKHNPYYGGCLGDHLTLFHVVTGLLKVFKMGDGRGGLTPETTIKKDPSSSGFSPIDRDVLRQGSETITITPQLAQKLKDLQTGRAPGLARGRKNDQEVVKFLQAVAGLEQTGKFDESLAQEVKRIQASYHIDSLDGRVSKDTSSQAAKFLGDGIVRDSIRAFIQKALDDQRLSEQDFQSVSTSFEAPTKRRWLFYAEPLASWSADIPNDYLNTVGATSFASRRGTFINPASSKIEASVDDIMEFVNTDESWSRLGLKGPVNQVGAQRILKALEVIALVESGHYDDANPSSSARGRYQFIEATVKLLRTHRVVTSNDFPSGATREKRLEQDFAAIWLIGSPVKGRMVLDDIVEDRPEAAIYQPSDEKRRGLVWEWAGLPRPNNMSAYESDINHANITYGEAVALMRVQGGGGYKETA